MKSYAFVLGFVSLLWLALGTYWLSSWSTCGADAALFSVTDGDFKTDRQTCFPSKCQKMW